MLPFAKPHQIWGAPISTTVDDQGENKNDQDHRGGSGDFDDSEPAPPPPPPSKKSPSSTESALAGKAAKGAEPLPKAPSLAHRHLRRARRHRRHAPPGFLQLHILPRPPAQSTRRGCFWGGRRRRRRTRVVFGPKSIGNIRSSSSSSNSSSGSGGSGSGGQGRSDLSKGSRAAAKDATVGNESGPAEDEKCAESGDVMADQTHREARGVRGGGRFEIFVVRELEQSCSTSTPRSSF